MALASASTFSGSVVRTPAEGEGLPKVCCRRTLRFGHLCSQCSNVCGNSLHSGHVRSATGSTKWAYDLRSCVCPHRRRALRTASAPFCTQWLFGPSWAGGSEVVCRMRSFADVSEMDRGSVSVAVAANSPAASLLGMRFWSGILTRIVGPFLLSTCWRIDWVSCAAL